MLHLLADEFMAGEEEVGDDGGGAEADGAFDYSTLAEAMDASGSDADTDDEEGGAGIDGLGGGPGGEMPSGSGAHRTLYAFADRNPVYEYCHKARTACCCLLRSCIAGHWRACCSCCCYKLPDTVAEGCRSMCRCGIG